MTTFALSTFGQNVWKNIEENQLTSKSNSDRSIVPDKLACFQLEYHKLVKNLKKAPLSTDPNRLENGVDLDLPFPDGSIRSFTFFESSTMSEKLAAKFPNIKSYTGICNSDPAIQSKIDFGYSGFHAVIITSNGSIYVDPYYNDFDESYMSYYIKDHKPNADQANFVCGHEDHVHSQAKNTDDSNIVNQRNLKRKSLPVIKTTYRMALACTGRWGSQQGTVTQVMSKFNTAVNRFNIIYENEVGINFQLIDDNDKLIFFNDTEPYINVDRGRDLIGENRAVVNATVGSESYDIGHVFTVRCTDGVGGIAALNSVCNPNKAAGVSCIGNAFVDRFVIGTAAHEVGHQFGATHVMNNCNENDMSESPVNNNITPGTAWEPGSGSTIMSYVGGCSQNNNVQSEADSYYNAGNIEQIYFHINNTDCGVEEMTNSNTPEIQTPIFGDGLVIPLVTPFELDGNATDSDGDNLTYNWDQHDTGPISITGSPILNAPSFRSLPPSESSLRIFPNRADLLAGRQNRFEVLPTYERDFTFLFTVRDNHLGAGSTVSEEIKFKSTDTAGPFRVTTPSSLEFVAAGQNYEVKWDVANTDNAIVDCQFVNIFLSTNGGVDFDQVLSLDTPNDGSETIVIPNIITDNARIKVKASNNIFFNVSRSELIIREPTEPGFFVTLSDNIFDVCLPNSVEIDLAGTSFLDFENPVDLDITEGLPEGANFSFTENPMSPDGTSKLEIDLSDIESTNSYEITLRAIAENADTLYRVIKLNLTGSDLTDLDLVSPDSGASGINGSQIFTWNKSTNAELYKIEISENPLFGTTNFYEFSDIIDTSFLPPVVLENSKLYYWKITGSNICNDGYSSGIRTLGTATLNCKVYESTDLPKNISASAETSVNSEIEIFDVGDIADVNVTKISGLHGRPRDLRASLISPIGTKVVLFDRECSSGSNFNLGIDSDAPIEFSCPLNSGQTMTPEAEDLALFNSEDIEGKWSLLLEDTKLGEGGQFQEFTLELCANGVFDAPFLVNNQILFIKTGETKRIVRNELLSEDSNNGPHQLTYTLVTPPTKGNLLISGVPIGLGGQFTQGNLDDGVVRYEHLGSENETDSFVFTVIDNEGGWIDLTQFDINIDENNTTSTEEIITDKSQFAIYPNPTNNLLYIFNNKQDNKNWNMELISLDGKTIATQKFSNKTSINVRGMNEGLYFVVLRNESGLITYKVQVTK